MSAGYYPGEDQYHQHAELSATTSIKHDSVVRFILLGDSCVGKTCFILQWADDAFNSVHIPTLGVDYKDRAVKNGKRELLIEIWDTASGDRFNDITGQLYDKIEGIVVMFDVSNGKSFDNVAKHMARAKEYMPDVPMVIVGNKSDIMESRREVTRSKAQVLAKEKNCHYFEMSVKQGRAVIDEVVTCLLGIALSRRRDLIKMRKSQKKQERSSCSASVGRSHSQEPSVYFPRSHSQEPSVSMSHAPSQRKSEALTRSRKKSLASNTVSRFRSGSDHPRFRNLLSRMRAKSQSKTVDKKAKKKCVIL